MTLWIKKNRCKSKFSKFFPFKIYFVNQFCHMYQRDVQKSCVYILETTQSSRCFQVFLQKKVERLNLFKLLFKPVIIIKWYKRTSINVFPIRRLIHSYKIWLNQTKQNESFGEFFFVQINFLLNSFIICLSASTKVLKTLKYKKYSKILHI